VLGLGFAAGTPARLLVVGAHPDDIEIGCGGTLLRLLEETSDLSICWVVACCEGVRADEARASAADVMSSTSNSQLHLGSFRDGYLPYAGAAVKEFLHEIGTGFAPDVVMTHQRDDLHQDHRLLGELAWQVFRDQLILEYEVAKYDGDLGQPNFFVPLDRSVCDRKLELLRRHFTSQADKPWFDDQAFLGLMRLRGVECRATSGLAEAFHGRRVVLARPGGA
jgi:LmbE family N-acetylglucosaminyl deacetylase